MKPFPGRDFWTEENKALALRMREDKKTCAEIGAAVGRTKHAVKVKLRKLLMTPEQRERYRSTERRRYQSRVPARDVGQIEFRPSESELQARNAKLAVSHHDLTAAYFSDPLPGYSALDRKRAGASA